MNTLYTKNINKLLIIGMTATLLTACGGSKYTKNYDVTTGEPIALGSDNPICQEGSSIQEGQVIDEETNSGIANVSVEIAGCVVSTDKNGFYKFTNIPSAERTSVNYKKDGYYKNSDIISIEKDTSNYVKFSLNAYKSWSKFEYSSTEGMHGHVSISENTKYKTIDNKEYEGKITGYWFLNDTATKLGKKSFPGTYQGIDSNENIVPFVSYGFMVVELMDEEGNALEVSESITLNLQNIKNTKEETIPLWYYNYDKGIWIENGIAQRDEKGNYICEIPHTGTWSVSKPIEAEMGLYKGTIVDVDGNPISNVRIEAVGKNWITKDLTTDENGEFEVSVVPNQTFTISAYDYKEKFGAEFEDTLPAITSGDIVEE